MTAVQDSVSLLMSFLGTVQDSVSLLMRFLGTVQDSISLLMSFLGTKCALQLVRRGSWIVDHGTIRVAQTPGSL